MSRSRFVSNLVSSYLHVSGGYYRQLPYARMSVSMMLATSEHRLHLVAFPQRRGRAVGRHSPVFVGRDIAKARDAIAIANSERRDEVRYLRELDTDSQRRSGEWVH
jgi:hypothetical protein